MDSGLHELVARRRRLVDHAAQQPEGAGAEVDEGVGHDDAAVPAEELPGAVHELHEAGHDPVGQASGGMLGVRGPVGVPVALLNRATSTGCQVSSASEM